MLNVMKLPENIKDYFRRQGKIGAKKRHSNLSPERRSEIASEAAKARWAKAKQEDSSSKRTK